MAVHLAAPSDRVVPVADAVDLSCTWHGRSRVRDLVVLRLRLVRVRHVGGDDQFRRVRRPGVVDDAPDSESDTSCLAAVDREYKAAKHRRFDVDYRTPPEFVARLALEGYEREDGLILLLEGEMLGPPPKEFDIRPLETEADWGVYWELMLKDWREHIAQLKRKVKDEIARQILQVKRLKQPPVQYFMAYVRDKPVAYFNSWAGIDGVGQVEDLFTLPKFRKRGIARALIHHCVADARAKGAGPVIVAANPADTPKRIYAAMGFRPVAVQSHYTKYLDG